MGIGARPSPARRTRRSLTAASIAYVDDFGCRACCTPRCCARRTRMPRIVVDPHDGRRGPCRACIAVLTGPESLEVDRPARRGSAPRRSSSTRSRSRRCATTARPVAVARRVPLHRRGRARRSSRSSTSRCPPSPTPRRRWPRAPRSCTRTSARTSSTSTRSRSATWTPTSPRADRIVRRELRWPRATARAAGDQRRRRAASTRRAGAWTSGRTPTCSTSAPGCMSATLGVAPHMLNFYPLSVGGSFGSKHFLAKQIGIAGALAKVTGRPVKFMEDRADNLLASDAQAPDRSHVAELALAADGTFRSLRIKVIDDYGAYFMLAIAGNTNPLSQIVGPVPDRQRHLRRHRGAHQQEPAGRVARRGLRRHQLGAGTAGRRRGRRARRRPGRAAPPQPHPARRVPLQDPHRNLYDSGDYPAVLGARWSWPTSTGGGPSRSAPAPKAVTSASGSPAPSSAAPTTPASSGSTTSAPRPRSRRRPRACGCGSAPPAGSPPRCSRRSGATRRRR